MSACLSVSLSLCLCVWSSASLFGDNENRSPYLHTAHVAAGHEFKSLEWQCNMSVCPSVRSSADLLRFYICINFQCGVPASLCIYIPPQRAYNLDDVGKTRKDSLGILNLVSYVTEREVKMNYRKIARIYHPDKHRPSSTNMSPDQAEEYFKLVNNTYAFLRTNA